MSIITLITDFGPRDAYVGVMKGVILGINSAVRLVDLTHEIPPQDVREAAWVLYTAYRYFPPDTVHLAVVDPGVGSARRPIAVQTTHGLFVGPDNGLFSYVIARELRIEDRGLKIADRFFPCEDFAILNPQSSILDLRHLTQAAYWRSEVSATFHGRDIFAPVAAHLSRGLPLAELGERIDNPVLFPLPAPERQPDGPLRAHVLHIDRFGNVITDVAGQDAAFLDAQSVVVVKGQVIEGVRRTYADVPIGALTALVGSSGHLEIAVRNGNAATVLDVQVGDEVRVHPAAGHAAGA